MKKIIFTFILLTSLISDLPNTPLSKVVDYEFG